MDMLNNKRVHGKQIKPYLGPFDGNGNVISIEEKFIPVEHQIFYNCTVNRTSQYCFSSMISASSIIMLLLAFLM